MTKYFLPYEVPRAARALNQSPNLCAYSPRSKLRQSTF